MMKKKFNKKGFTLIELIVVIAVIAILAAVLLPRFTGFSDSAKKSAVMSEAKNIATAVVAIKAEGLDSTISKTDITSKYTNYDGSLYLDADGDFIYIKNGYGVEYDYDTGDFADAIAADALDDFTSSGVTATTVLS